MTVFQRVVVCPAVLLAAALAGPSGATAQAATSARSTRPQGVPITSDAVIRNCASCHTRDSTGRLSRLSYMRKTPEGWETSIRRMVTLNGVQLEPETAREIVRDLSNTLGLAPEELGPGRFEVERRSLDYTYSADKDTENTCKPCHSMGRVITQRRTKDEWGLLVATHRGYYPLSEFQAFRRTGPLPREPGPDGRPPDPRHPMDKAIDHLAGAFPFETPEWTAWSATMRPPRLEGTWVLTGHEAGRGPVYGRVVITPGSRPDEFSTEAVYSHATTRRVVTRAGRAVVYTGHQWRGRSFAGSADSTGMREVMQVERDWRAISGRWFTGGYDEFGVDVTLRRVGQEPSIAGVHPRALRRQIDEQDVTVYGANFPADLRASGVDFGPGVQVRSLTRTTPDAVTLRLGVASDAAIGARDLFIAGIAHREALVVYDQVQRIRVEPQAGMARVGGVRFPKQFQQFEAVGFHNGADEKPDTKDDLNLGPVPVTWTLEEYSVTYEDDDVKFVGQLDANGLFSPAADGPNPNRSGNRNNVGDVWVVATYNPGGDAKPLRSRAHVLVTVPLYLRWEPWRVEQ
jgi:quinohemoprotein amine dehydrogenase